MKSKTAKVFIAALILICSRGMLYAQEESGDKVPISITGDQVEYFKDENKAVGTGNVVVTHKNSKLTADKVTIYNQTKDAIAEGNAKLERATGETMEGSRIEYNFDTKEGVFYETAFSAPPVYGKADKVNRLGETHFQAEKGYFTTCDKEDPHYRIVAKRIDIYPGDKIVCKNCHLLFGKVPVLWLPHYNYSLKERFHMTVSPGKDKDWGLYVLTSTRFEFNQEAKGFIHLDYREKKDFASGVDFKYDTLEFGDGLFRTYYMHERDITDNHLWDEREQPTEERERFRVQLRHRWDQDEDTVWLLEYHEQHDPAFIKDYFYSQEFERESNPESYLSYTRVFPVGTLNFQTRKRTNRFDSRTERLPDVKFDVNATRIGESSFYYSSSQGMAALQNKRANSDIDDDAGRIDSYNRLTYTRKFFGWLNVSPYSSVRQTYFTKDAAGDEDRYRGIFDSGIEASTRIFRIFDQFTDWLGLDINRMRHIITPSASYSYVHDPTIPSGELFQFDGIDSIARSNQVNLKLENKLQTKRQVGERWKNFDIASLIFDTDYMFQAEDGSRFSNLRLNLELIPYDWLRFDADTSYNHKTRDFETANFDIFAIGKGDIDFYKKSRPDNFEMYEEFNKNKWKLGWSHRYSQNSSTQEIMEFSYQINDKYRLRTYQRFNIKRIEGANKFINDSVDQFYGLIADLHCWWGEINYEVGEGESIWLVFRLKAQPENTLKLDKSYHNPKAGNQHGYY